LFILMFLSYMFEHECPILGFPTSGGRSVGIVRSRTHTMEFSFLVTKVRTHVTLIDRKPLKRNRVLNEEKPDDICIY
jgi:hypothetical protein